MSLSDSYYEILHIVPMTKRVQMFKPEHDTAGSDALFKFTSVNNSAK